MTIYKVTTSYTLEIKARDKNEAKDLFLETLDRVDPNWIEDQIDVVEVKKL